MVICVVGLGYVGLPLSLAFSKQGINTIGFDSSIKRIEELKKNIDINGEFSKLQLSCSKISFTYNSSDIFKANYYIITVPTPVNKDKSPNLKPLLEASKIVGKNLTKNNIVIYESTVYPGCTEEECIPILESNSKLIFNKDFFCGYSPERINPGDKKRKLKDIIKVTSGSNNATARKVDNLYKKIIDAGTYLAPSIKIAEASKIIENIQRDVNISLMNELAIIFNKLGIDTKDVLKAASTKWNFLNFKPGLVGGHCIGVDPYYLAYKAKKLKYIPNVILAGRKVNNKMGKHISDEICKLLIDRNLKLENCNALILGVTFKENCSDLRNSRVFNLHKSLIKRKIKVDLYDPYAINDEVNKIYNLSLIKKIKKKYNVVILAVAHDEFLNLDISNFKKINGVVYDVKSVLKKDEVTARL